MRKRLLLFCALAFLLTLAACGGGSNESAVPPAPGGANAPSGGGAAAPAATATLSGKIAFEGTPPPNAKIQMSADPYCQQHNPNATDVTKKINKSVGSLLIALRRLIGSSSV